MKPVNAFPGLLHAFFYERLVQQLNVSPHTVRSYRDTWRLFLRFASIAIHEQGLSRSARLSSEQGLEQRDRLGPQRADALLAAFAKEANRHGRLESDRLRTDIECFLYPRAGCG